MFILKKIVTPFLIPPGLFVGIFIIAGLWLIKRRKFKAGIFNVLIGIILWLVCMAPVGEFMMKPLEGDLSVPQNPRGDVIIVLGGGADDQVRDLSGDGFLMPESLGRLVTAARLQKMMKVPIIYSSGQVYPQRHAEAPIAKRILVDIGIPHSKIIVEAQSRDTIENARYSKQLCRQFGFKTPIVVTSAYHMKRSILSFQKVGMDVIPYPANFRTAKHCRYYWDDFLPDIRALETVSAAMREYIGLVFYQWVY
ncbi:MAG: YdcF family protein [Deltaproteobacteria bacterium]|nr:YdcF family protein [Deltaproteobacteria bacterium]